MSDYCRTAPRYGTNEDPKRLFQEVHHREMHILLDLIPGHTSVEHPWFRQSMRAERNDFTDRYVWTDSIWEHPEGKGTMALWQEVRGFLAQEFPEAAMVSKWGEPDKSLAGGFHMDFLLHFGPSHYNDLFHCDEPFFPAGERGTCPNLWRPTGPITQKPGGRD